MKQQVILLTGGSSGIGLEIAKLLMNRGAIVYSASRRLGVSQQSTQNAGQIIPIRLDINNEEETKQIIQQILLHTQRLDAVICNAGNGIAGAVEDTSTDEVRYQLETNFFGAVKTINACLPIFRQQGFGKIMATSSVAAIVPIPYQAFYSAGKAALFSFMQALSIEVKPFGIQCCTVLPGDTQTDFTTARKFSEASQCPDSAYRLRMKRSVEKMMRDEEHGMKASFVARKMVRQITNRHMKPVLVPGIQYQLICGLFHVFPLRLSLWIIRRLYN